MICPHTRCHDKTAIYHFERCGKIKSEGKTEREGETECPQGRAKIIAPNIKNQIAPFVRTAIATNANLIRMF